LNIPDKVKIGYKDFKVNMVEDHVIDEGMICYGNIEYDKGNINISTLHSEDQQKCIFIHECLHGIDDVFEIGLDEAQVRKIAKGICAFIRDNPDLFSKHKGGNQIIVNMPNISENADIDIMAEELNKRIDQATHGAL
jgi:ferredoxin